MQDSFIDQAVGIVGVIVVRGLHWERPVLSSWSVGLAVASMAFEAMFATADSTFYRKPEARLIHTEIAFFRLRSGESEAVRITIKLHYS